MYNENMVNRNRFDFDKVMIENFTCEDSFLKNKKFYNNLTESEKLAVGDISASKILRSSSKQLEYLNKRKFFGDIPATKGVYSKSSLYAPTKSITGGVLPTIYAKAKGANVNEAKECLNIVSFALDNVLLNKEYWQKAYRDNDTKIILYYQCMATLVTIGASALFINTVNVDPNCNMVYKDIPKRGYLSKNRVIKELEKFNDICRNRKLPEFKKFNEYLEEVDENLYSFEEVALPNDILNSVNNRLSRPRDNSENSISATVSEFKNSHPGAARTAGIIAGTLAISGLIMAVIYASRFAIMFFFYLKNDIAETLKYLSTVVEGNAIANQYDPSKSGRIAEKQLALSKKIAELGKKLDDDYKQAEFNASNKVVSADKQISNDIEAEITNNSAAGDLFI